MLSRGRALDLMLGGLAAAQLGASVWLQPAGNSVTLANGSPLGGLCWVHSLFDVECPMCGMTRSFVALAHGHLGAALRFHPAGPFLFVMMAVLVGAVAVAAVRRARPLVERRRFLLAFETVALVCVAVGVFKILRS